MNRSYCQVTQLAEVPKKPSSPHLSFTITILLPQSREHIGNIDDSLMLSSITSMMHQFYIEHRKHWWIFDVTSMFQLCFQRFSTLRPAMFHLVNVNDWSKKHRWFISETMMNHRWRNSTFTCFRAKFWAIKLSIFHIKSSFPIILSQNFFWKTNEHKFERWSKTFWLLVSKMIFDHVKTSQDYTKLNKASIFWKKLSLVFIGDLQCFHRNHQCFPSTIHQWNTN